MALKKEELQIIGKYVQEHLTEWLLNNLTYLQAASTL